MFCGAHIGALAQRLGRNIQSQVVGRQGHHGRGIQPRVERRRWLPRQNCQAVARLGQAALQRRYLGGGLLCRSPGLFGHQRGGQPGLQAPLCNLQGFLLAGQIAARNLQALLQAAQLDVIHGHFSRQ